MNLRSFRSSAWAALQQATIIHSNERTIQQAALSAWIVRWKQTFFDFIEYRIQSTLWNPHHPTEHVRNRPDPPMFQPSFPTLPSSATSQGHVCGEGMDRRRACRSQHLRKLWTEGESKMFRYWKYSCFTYPLSISIRITSHSCVIFSFFCSLKAHWGYVSTSTEVLIVWTVIPTIQGR